MDKIQKLSNSEFYLNYLTNEIKIGIPAMSMEQSICLDKPWLFLNRLIN
jgi:hypothetical protein